jgi:hypothetical protein
MIENKIEKLFSLIESTMKGSKLDYALILLNEIIDKVNLDESIIKRFKARTINVELGHYDTFIEKCIFVMQAIGLDLTQISNYDDEALTFIANHKHLYKEPLTPERLDNLLRLYMYHEMSTGQKPTNIKQLADAYTEIKENR